MPAESSLELLAGMLVMSTDSSDGVLVGTEDVSPGSLESALLFWDSSAGLSLLRRTKI